MKKFDNYDFVSTLETVLRILGGIFFILAGIAIIMLHGIKVVPTGWETSDIIGTLTLVWAYLGPFIGVALIVCGIWIMDVFDHIVEWLEKQGWL